MVVATLNFTPAGTGDVDLWLYDQDKHEPLPVTSHEVTVHDARAERFEANVDRNGFELAPCSAEIEFNADAGTVKTSYYPAMEALVRERLGAKRVFAFDHDFRTSRRIVQNEHLRGVVPNAHNDYTEVSGPQRLRELLPDEADELLKRRYAFINVWKPVGYAAEETPLAMCDVQSLSPGDLATMHLHYRHRLGQIYGLRHNDKQRWYYYPNMLSSEVVYLKCYDSDKAQSRFTAHTAFKDPSSRADAPSRQSIEVRTIAFF